MAEEIPIPSKTEAQSAQAASDSGTAGQSVSLNLSHAVSLCAVGLLVCFFLPWIDFLLGKPSGLDFTKQGGKFQLLWAIPIFCAFTVLAGITKSSQRVVAQLTGALPFFVLVVGLKEEGGDLLRVLGIGGYGSLALGLLLLILPRRLK
jgi:hypothetical protein